MSKHNIIEILDYKKNKDKIKNENECFHFLEQLSDRIKMSQEYAKGLRQYLEAMVKDGNIKQCFADNLNNQIDFMLEEFSQELRRAKK